MPNAIGYAATDPASGMAPFHFDRRAPRPDDVKIAILYCGVCHSDLHQARNDWGGTTYPCCPGHEIVGRVTEVGPRVSKFREGDLAAVGCLVDSCMDCDQCRKGEEQLCRNRSTGTYNGKDRITGEITYGGYSDHIVVREAFVLKVPETLDITRVAETLAKKITGMNPGQGFAASLVTAGLVTTASLHSLPVSTTHVSVGALLGMGAASRQVYWRKVAEILLAWVSTVPCGALLAGLAYVLLARFS